MTETIISDLKENSLQCELCKSKNTRNVKTYDEDGRITDSWWRCLNCNKDYGAKLHFYKTPDGTKIKTEILWKREIKE